jgi:hypothetical protein
MQDRITEKPRLTGPHVCHACKGEINQAFGHRRATIIHRLPAHGDKPAGDPCRMDIYAAIYTCPNTVCRTLLESPSNQWGEMIACPACETRFLAPRDDILHEHAGDAREGQVIRFRCPSCHTTLRCDSTLQGHPMTGQRVVCNFCRNIIEVPGGGAATGPQGQAIPDPREAVHQSTQRRCSNPACRQMIPSRAEQCPVCTQPQTP